MAKIHVLLLCLIVQICFWASQEQEESNLLAFASFDFAQTMFPKTNVKTEGAAVISKNFVKLIPPVAQRTGRLSFQRRLKTPSFQMDFVVRINQAFDGFAVWYLNERLGQDKTTGTLFGSRNEYSGLGVFITKDHKNKWVIHGRTNRGMEPVVILPEKFNGGNTWAILGAVENVPRSIRIDKNGDKLTVLIRGENSDLFEQWFSFSDPMLHFSGFLSMSAQNDNYINDININSIYLHNTDPNSYKYGSYKDTLGTINPSSARYEDVIGGVNPNNTAKRNNKWKKELHRVKKTDDEVSIIQKLHELQKVYQLNLRSFMNEFMSATANNEKIIGFTKEKVLDLSKTYQEIEVKVQNVINERFKGMTSYDQNDYNKIIGIVNQIEMLEKKIINLEVTLNDLIATSTKLVMSKATDEANTSRVMKTQLVNVLEQTTNAGQYIENNSGSAIFTWVLFILVLVGIAIVARKYYSAKKAHLL